MNCVNCNKLFRNTYDINRHLSRNKPCSINNSPENNTHNENNTSEDPKTSLTGTEKSLTGTENTLTETENTLTATENTLTATENTLTATENNTCKYCLHTFTRIDNKNIHEKTCKYLDDPIRLLEIENDIIPELPESKTECRFCNKIFSRTDNLNTRITICKEREVYHKILIKEKEQKTSIDHSLNKAFKSSANQLYNKKEEINTANERVLKNKTVDGMFSEIDNFAGRGFRNSYNPTDLRTVRSNFKVSKLKNKVETDF